MTLIVIRTAPCCWKRSPASPVFIIWMKSTSGLYIHIQVFKCSSVQEFANVASLPSAKRVSDLTREELEEIVERAMNATNWDAAYYMELFDKNVPMPNASNLIFHPPEEYSGDIADYNPSPEEIVALAMAENNVVQF
ncbi:MAG: hypothetical protein ABJL99_07810 [Aliishimia sp.]